jgi:predicted AAA+ superfamily ATPase
MIGSKEISLQALLGKQIRSARRRAAAITVFRGVLDDTVSQAFLQLLEYLDARPVAGTTGGDAGGPAPVSGSKVAAAYARVFALLAESAAPAVPSTDAWQSHLLWRVVDCCNPFSVLAERAGIESVPSSLLDQARRDLRGLQWLYSLGADAIRDAAVHLVGVDLAEALGPWRELGVAATGDQPRLAMVARLGSALDWGALAEDLANHWHTHGLGLFARHHAAQWTTDEGGGLVAYSHVDPIRLADLVAYDAERAPLIRNTERFVSGLPAQHCLIYGERGTGKSSTVKALLPNFAGRGLRLVELSKDHLSDLRTVLSLLQDHPQRFIIFVDDLSFEEQETQYKALKSALEGRVEAWPSNVVLYVTTNRRHLVKERFSDREGTVDGEVRPRDTMEEKLSLADRFGLQIAFPSPDQERYVAIAATLAQVRGVALADDEIRRRAIQWALWHNGRSCRSARQFVDDLVGECP